MVCSARALLTSSSCAHASAHLYSDISFLKRRASVQLWVSGSLSLTHSHSLFLSHTHATTFILQALIRRRVTSGNIAQEAKRRCEIET
jgi:hypothetical protein